ncbi:unnamed protein product [Orchesella dallaii]|uniref:Amidase domain-containing protein n=1 Tax=Orchesella dallaii TaxID=48710 RepID=A0ABP1QB44_9HEXA
MTECKLEMESPYLFLLLVVTLLLSLAYTVHASGSYMHAARGKLDGTTVFNTKTQSTESTEVTFNESPLPEISDNAHVLRDTDEKYALCNGIDIREITISQIQVLFNSNKLTSVDLTNCYLQRIYRMNPVLKAVIEINPNAIVEATKADMERLYKKIRGPLHGIPVLLKDNIGTADFMDTTAGSAAFIGIRVKKDADVVKYLQKSGAVIIGKANLSEFAYFRGTNLPSGWSSKGGQTRNAYNMNVTPEGSSSGSAVAVAANLATVSVGSETDGSLVAPASVGGICTMKPTHDLISTNVVIPISHNQDTLGPMARTVLDVAILLDGMLPASKRPCGGSYAQCILHNGNKNKFRIGVLRYPFWDISVINSTNLRFELPLLENIIHNMHNSLQFDIVDPVASKPGQLSKVSSNNELTVLLHDFKFGINKYLSNDIISPFPVPSHYKPSSKYLPPKAAPMKIASLKDIIKFNDEHLSIEGYNQELLLLSEATDGLNNRTYIEARDSNRAAARELLNSVISTYKLDAIVVPSEPRFESVLDENLQDSPVVGYSIAAIAGYPSISIPAGIGLKDVPFGMTFIGMPRAEPTLLQIAHAVEQMGQGPRRKPPRFLS